MPSVRKRTNIPKSIRKSARQEAIYTKTLFQLANLLESIYIKRPAVRKHAARLTAVRKHKYSIRKHIITMPSVRKRITIFKSIRKRRTQEAVRTKTLFNMQFFFFEQVCHELHVFVRLAS